MKIAALTVALALTASTAFADERTRDWTVEKPMTSGYLYGLSLLTCRRCALGEASEAASSQDPFGMTASVRAELMRLGQGPHTLGTVAGVSSTIYLIGGLFFRRRNRLLAKEVTV